MAAKTDKGVIVSFRVDRHLADVLNKVPDKSSFIRDIILRSFYDTCPLCRGRGVLPEELAAWAAAALKRDKAVDCSCCKYPYPTSAVAKDARPKRGGRFTCPHCQTHEHSH